MNNSLRMMGIYIIWWCVFNIVSASAATVNSESTEFNSILKNNVIVNLDVHDYKDVAIPLITNSTGEADGISSFGLPRLEENMTTSVDNIGYDSKINDNGITDLYADDFQNVTIPAEADVTGEATGISSSFGLPRFEESMTTSVYNTGYDSELNDNGEANLYVDDSKYVIIPEEANVTGKTTGISSSFGLPRSDESINPLEPRDTENTTPASVTTSTQSAFANAAESPPAETASLDTANVSSGNASNEGNSLFAPELEIYAILLVCLGLMGFTARRRRDVI